MRDTGCAGGELEDRADHSLASTGIRCRVVIVEGDGAVVFFPGIQVCSGIRGIPVIPTAVCELHGDIFGLQCRAAGLDGSSELAAQQLTDKRRPAHGRHIFMAPAVALDADETGLRQFAQLRLRQLVGPPMSPAIMKIVAFIWYFCSSGRSSV